MLGLDSENKVVYIKPINKDESTRGSIDINEQYKITVKNSYARVSNKSFITEIKKIINIDDLTNPKKFITSFDDENKTLLIDLKRGIEND